MHTHQSPAQAKLAATLTDGAMPWLQVHLHLQRRLNLLAHAVPGQQPPHQYQPGTAFQA